MILMKLMQWMWGWCSWAPPGGPGHGTAFLLQGGPPALPMYLLVSSDCYALGTVGYRVAIFHGCKDAALELLILRFTISPQIDWTVEVNI
uniref:Dolichol-phosphate mannosyltransferase subunit 3 n=1 Tax=Moschus moschiferus TaxID=68415 RepID=A0A8C6DK05_MOSMO